jgi:hypothetical protein
MPEIGTSGLMSGDGKRGGALRQYSRPSSTLPRADVRERRAEEMWRWLQRSSGRKNEQSFRGNGWGHFRLRDRVRVGLRAIGAHFSEAFGSAAGVRRNSISRWWRANSAGLTRPADKGSATDSWTPSRSKPYALRCALVRRSSAILCEWLRPGPVPAPSLSIPAAATR